MRRVTPDDIAIEVADRFDLEVYAVLGHDRAKRKVHARRLFWTLCRDLTPLSFPEIGMLGGWSHSTVLEGVAAFRDMIATSKSLKPGEAGRVDAGTVLDEVRQAVYARVSMCEHVPALGFVLQVDVRVDICPSPGGGFLATSPDDPRLVTDGDTVEEALAMARDAMKALVASDRRVA